MMNTEFILGICYGGTLSFFVGLVYIQLKYVPRERRTKLLSSIKESLKGNNKVETTEEFERLKMIISNQSERLK